MLVFIGFCAGFAGASAMEATDETPKTSKNAVNIAMALDEGYLYPTVVSMTSMLENKNEKSEYHYYIMHPGDFSERSKEILKSLERKYPNCVVNLINMENKFKTARQGHVTTPAYYRLALSDILPTDEDRVIWLDGDTIIFKDLTEMFNLDMTGYCYKGFLDYPYHLHELDAFGIKSRDYICSGVMLLNLEELRKNDAVSRYEKFIEKNNAKLSCHDQTTINVMFHDKIGILPAKYGLFNFHTKQEAMEYPNRLRSNKKYTAREMKAAFNNPYLFHYVKFKPWRGHKCKNGLINGIEVWWQYAEKTDYFNEIKEKYSLKDGIYTIESSVDSDKILGVDLNKASKSSLNVKLIDQTKNGKQIFKVSYVGDGCYEIKSLETGKLLNVSGARKEDGANIDLHKSNGTDAQKWYIFKKDGNTWSIVSKCNQKCADVFKVKKEAGANIYCWPFNKTDSQKFKFRKVS